MAEFQVKIRNANQAQIAIKKACKTAATYIEPIANTKLNWTIDELKYIEDIAVECISTASTVQGYGECCEDAATRFESAFGPIQSLALQPNLWTYVDH